MDTPKTVAQEVMKLGNIAADLWMENLKTTEHFAMNEETQEFAKLIYSLAYAEGFTKGCAN